MKTIIHSRPATARGFTTHLARGTQDILSAQRLRYRVFGQEQGAHMPHATLGIDRDRFDAWCDHLVVRSDATGDVVGTYRILPSLRTHRTDGFYCETEFDLRRLQALGTRAIEVGRACVDPAHRNGTVLALLWTGLANYIRASGCSYVLGCASIPVGDDPRGAAAVCRRVLEQHRGPDEWRVAPYRPFSLDQAPPDVPGSVPALLRGYLRMGASVCGAPAWDPDFRTADLLLLLTVEHINARWADRLFRAA